MSSKKKLFAIIAAVAMLAGMLAFGAIPSLAGSASAGATNVVTFAPSAAGEVTMGTIVISGLPNYGTAGSVYLALPASDGYSFATSMAATYPGGGNAPNTSYNNGIGSTTIVGTVNPTLEENLQVYEGMVEVDYTMNGSGNNGTIYITTPVVMNDVPSAGAVNVTVWGKPGDEGLSNTSVQVANVVSSGTGVATVAAASVPTIGVDNTTATGTLTISENVAGAIFNNSGDVTLTLPSGYNWEDLSTATLPVIQGWSGLTNAILTGNGTDELTITPGNDTSSGLLWISGLEIQTPSNATVGALDATLGGAASGTLQVATVGNYSATVTAASNPDTVYSDLGGTTGTTIPAGVTDYSGSVQSISDIYITESMAGSLVGGRNITLTLPAGLAWDNSNNGKGKPNAATPGTAQLSDISMSLTAGSWNGNWNGNGGNPTTLAITQNNLSSSNNVLTLTTPANSSSSAVTIDIKAHIYTLASNYTGPLTITVGGSAGVTGTVTDGTVAAPLTVTAASTPTLNMGVQNQQIGNVSITEASNGNLGSSNSNVDVVAPIGATFVGTPSVSVTTGDLQIGSASVTTANDGQSEIQIPITNSSNTASTVKITGLELSLNSGLALGPLNLQINDSYGNDVASVAVGNVVAAGASSNTASFTVGANVYSVGGVDYVMDAAPFISNGRTFVPVRYLADSLGATVAWDGTTQTVTITSGSNTVVLTIGSTTETVNGTAQTMDVAPVIVNGRTMLPARWVAEALGYQVGWNPATQVVLLSK